MDTQEIRLQFLHRAETLGYQRISPSRLAMVDDDSECTLNATGAHLPHILGAPRHDAYRMTDIGRFVHARADTCGSHITFHETLEAWTLGRWPLPEQIDTLRSFLIDGFALDPRRIQVITSGLGSTSSSTAGTAGGLRATIYYSLPSNEPRSLSPTPTLHGDERALRIGTWVCTPSAIADGRGAHSECPRTDAQFLLDRVAAASLECADIFQISTLWPLIDQISHESGVAYDQAPAAMRVIADHIRTVVFIAADAKTTASTRVHDDAISRLVRRARRCSRQLKLPADALACLSLTVIDIYACAYPQLREHEESVFTAVETAGQYRDFAASTEATRMPRVGSGDRRA